MCGIAGVLFSEPSRLPDGSALVAMSSRLAHRGPDGHGTFASPGIGLVHRRLSIIDLASGRQPMTNVALAPRATVRDLIDQETARQLLREHVSRRARHGQVLWSLLVLAHWAETYLKGGHDRKQPALVDRDQNVHFEMGATA